MSRESIPNGSPRTALIGAITVMALIAVFLLAVLSRKQSDVPLVIVAPQGTAIEVDGREPRVLPAQPGTDAALASFYYLIPPGEYAVRYRQPGAGERVQKVQVANSDRPIIYTLLRDSLHEMQARVR